MFRTGSRSIIRNFSIALASALVAIAAAVYSLSLWNVAEQTEQDLQKQSLRHLETLAEILGKPLWDFDDMAIRHIGLAYTQNETIDALHITDANGLIVFEHGEMPNTAENSYFGAISYRGHTVGKVAFRLSLAYRQAIEKEFRDAFLLTIALVLIVTLAAAGTLLGLFLKRPMDAFTSRVKAFAEGDKSLLENACPATEFQILSDVLLEMGNILSDHIDTLETMVEARTHDLQKERNLLHDVLESISDGIVLFDTHQRFVMCNSAYRQNHAAIAELLKPGTHASDLLSAMLGSGLWVMPKEQWDLVIERRTQEIADASGANEITREDGRIFYATDHRTSSGGTLIIRVDISKLKMLESQFLQSQKMETIGHLAGGVAHDFNNLMSIILGNAELLTMQPGRDLAKGKHLDTIIRTVHKGSALTQRLLAYSRQQSLSPQPTKINELIAGIQEMLERTLGETVRLVLQPAEDSPTAEIDPHQLENALLNLAVNARHAMPDGGELNIRVTTTTLPPGELSADAAYPDQPHVLVEVSDTGTGMTADVMKQAFEPFFTTKEVGQGSGLGLSMVYGFIKQSGGHVTLHSTLGRGTTVSLYLPCAEAPAPTPHEPRDTAAQTRGSEHILVVEDDPLLREITQELLEQSGYTISTAPSGHEALETLSQDDSIDMLFTDMVLPGGLSGAQIADRARLHNPGLKVIYTTGYSEDSLEMGTRLQAGVNLAKKPYDRIELLAMIRNMLDGPSNHSPD